MGILPVSLADYAKLLKWTAQRLRSGQRDEIPQDLAAVLDHFDVQQDAWLDTVEKYESTFGHAVGHADSLPAVAERMETQRMKGVSACRSDAVSVSLPTLRPRCAPNNRSGHYITTLRHTRLPGFVFRIC